MTKKLQTKEPRPIWVMPEWMEKYREDITNTGGNSVEELQNDTDSNFGNNLPRTALIIAISAQIGLLQNLHKKGVI